MNQEQLTAAVAQQQEIAKGIALVSSQMKLVENYMTNESGSPLFNSTTDVVCKIADDLESLAHLAADNAAKMEGIKLTHE